MHQFDLFRQKLIEAVLDDRVRLAAADLHDHPWFCDDPPDLAQYLLRDPVIAVFIQVLHRFAPGPAPTPPHSIPRVRPFLQGT